MHQTIHLKAKTYLMTKKNKSSPLRDRFGIVQRLEFYSPEELCQIVTRSAAILEIEIKDKGAEEISIRARGTPRIANRLLRRVRDYAQVKADGVITGEISSRALDMLNVDAHGFDMMDRKLLLAILQKFDGGPVGVDSLAALGLRARNWHRNRGKSAFLGRP